MYMVLRSQTALSSIKVGKMPTACRNGGQGSGMTPGNNEVCGIYSLSYPGAWTFVCSFRACLTVQATTPCVCVSVSSVGTHCFNRACSRFCARRLSVPSPSVVYKVLRY